MWVYYTEPIKRVGGSPKKIMVLVTTLGMDVPLTYFFCKYRNIKIRLMSNILEGVLTDTKKIINF